MDAFTDEDTNVSISLKIAEGDLNYSSTGITLDDALAIAAESPTFRSIFETLLRSRRGNDPAYEWFRTHLGRMKDRKENPSDLTHEALVEMIKLQNKVNEAYAKLAILLGEAYVGKAKR